MNILIHLNTKLVAEAIYQFLAADGTDTVMLKEESSGYGFTPQVILMDVITVSHSNVSQYGGAKVVLIDTGMETEKLLSALLSHDVHGVVSTKMGLHSLRRALLAVIQGDIWIDSDPLKAVLEENGSLSRRGKINGITARHQEIIDCVCQGLSNKEIAQELGLSPDTVKAHLNRIFRKLHISSREQLMALTMNRPDYALERSA